MHFWLKSIIQEKFVVEICPFWGLNTVLMRCWHISYALQIHNVFLVSLRILTNLQGFYNITIIEKFETFIFPCAESWHTLTHHPLYLVHLASTGLPSFLKVPKFFVA